MWSRWWCNECRQVLLVESKVVLYLACDACLSDKTAALHSAGESANGSATPCFGDYAGNGGSGKDLSDSFGFDFCENRTFPCRYVAIPRQSSSVKPTIRI